MSVTPLSLARRGPYPIILTGPTAIGKTAVSLELSRLLPIRVISADSMQVYRRMNIGTAKPSGEEQQMVPHYGIDLVEPVRLFSVVEWLAVAVPAIRETLAAGEWPIIVGGTRLYIHGLTGAFDPASAPDPAIRARLEAESDASGIQSLHARLGQVDPASAERLNPNDRKRIIRALEVFESSGRTISDIQARSRSQAPLANALKIALVREREQLYRSVERRTDVLIGDGWIEEVRGLLDQGFGPGIELIKAHGYRELAAYLRGEMPLAAAVEIINKNVRRYVRYQLGWIRRLDGLELLNADEPAPVLARRTATLIA